MLYGAIAGNTVASALTSGVITSISGNVITVSPATGPVVGTSNLYVFANKNANCATVHAYASRRHVLAVKVTTKWEHFWHL